MTRNAATLFQVSALPRSAFNEIAEAPLLVFDGRAADAQHRVYLQSLFPPKETTKTMFRSQEAHR